MNTLPESDWRVYRELKPLVVTRFFDGMIAEVEKTLAAPAPDSRQRFWNVHNLMKEQAKEAADSLDGDSRSFALFKLALYRRGGWVKDEEMARFTAATQRQIESMLSFRL